jgi:hypothetical protein
MNINQQIGWPTEQDYDRLITTLIRERDEARAIATKLRYAGNCLQCDTFLTRHECEWSDATGQFDQREADWIYDG